MRPLVRLVLGLAGLVVILLGVAMALPSHVSVTRSIVINAPEGAVFPYVNSPRRFNQWSPWAARDREAQFAFSGPEEGKGARMQWSSNNPSVGSGALEITESEPNRRVELSLDLDGVGEATAFYELVPSGSGSRITWGYDAETGNNPLKRWQGLFLERLVGADFNDGLARLKGLVEGESQPESQLPSPAPAPEGGSTTVPRSP